MGDVLVSYTLRVHLLPEQLADLGLPATPGVVAYFHAVDVDAREGFGLAELTGDIAKALTWPTAVAAIEAWQQQSTVKPLRLHDGKPNRPLTAYTVELIRT